MDDRTARLIAKYSPSSTQRHRSARRTSPERLRAMRFAPSSPRTATTTPATSGGRRSPGAGGGGSARRTSLTRRSPERTASPEAAWPHNTVRPVSTPPVTMDFPPRTASHWTDDAMVPRAEFDAYVRSTERILSQLQGAVDEAVADRMSVKGALDRLASHDRRLHALERGWHEALKRLSEVEENAARPPDLKLVEARCAWLEDELREQVKPFPTRLSPSFLGRF